MPCTLIARADGLGVALAAAGFLFNIVFLFINTALFVYAIKTYSMGSKETDFGDVGAPFASVALALISGFVFKTAADRTR